MRKTLLMEASRSEELPRKLQRDGLGRFGRSACDRGIGDQLPSCRRFHSRNEDAISCQGDCEDCSETARRKYGYRRKER